MGKTRTFVNDADGFSAKDFVLLIFTVFYLLLLLFVLFLTWTGEQVPGVIIQIVGSVENILMVIIGGLFTVQGVKEYRRREKNDAYESEEKSQEPNHLSLP